MTLESALHDRMRREMYGLATIQILDALTLEGLSLAEAWAQIERWQGTGTIVARSGRWHLPDPASAQAGAAARDAPR